MNMNMKKIKVVRPPHIHGKGAPPADVIALGPKQKSTDAGRSISDLGILPMKKPKMSQPQSSSSSPSHHHHHQRVSPVFPEPNVKLIDIPSQDLYSKIIDENDFDLVNSMLCGAIKHLRNNRSKLDQTLYCSLFALAKERPGIFTASVVVESLVCILKKDSTAEYMKSKLNSMSAVVAANLLMHAFEISHTWPPILIKVFLDDSLGDRVWVDNPQCATFVRNICTIFGTKFCKYSSSDDRKSGSDDTESVAIEDVNYPNRFATDAEVTLSYAVDTVKERMSRRQGNIPTQDALGAQSKNLLKTLATMAGIPEIRLLSSQKLEMWLQNPKLVKPCKNLIMGICINCNLQCQENVDVISHLTRMRVKNKANLTSYIHCLKQLVQVNSSNMSTLFHYLVYNELSSARNPINMTVISAMLQFKPVESAKTMAIVWQDLLLQSEDYLRASRGLIREIVRASKYTVHFPSLTLGFLQEPDNEKFSRLDQHHKERFVNSTVDITCLLMLLSVTPQVKDTLLVMKSNSNPLTEEQQSLYVKHKMELAEMQFAAIWWLQSIAVPKLLQRITQNEFIGHFQKLLFLKANDVSYHAKDNWPPEADRSFLLKACGDVPVLEDTIVRLIMIGLSTELPIPPAEVLEIINVVVKRAAHLAKPDFNPIPVENVNVCDMLLSLSQYHHPENIKLPSEYVPPSLAILQFYWTVWRILLMISAFNPSTIGYHAWTNFPILKNFMEMAIINNFTFPPATVVEEQERSLLISKEQQMVQVEKSEILEFESYLAAATTHLAVTEESSLLLTQLIAMDTTGTARRPPDAVASMTKALCKDLQLGSWLSRSRNPDFLLDIINRYGENQQMPWLASVVSSASGDMAMLPVQCLCEFLLSKNTEESNVHKNELIERLYNILISDKIDDASQIIRYFIHRLHLPQLEQRKNARRALASVCELFPTVASNLNMTDIPEFEWLLSKIEIIPVFQFIRKEISQEIQIAIRCETDPIAIVAYASYLANDVMKITPETYMDFSDMLQNVALTISQVLIERSFLVDSIMGHVYDNIALIFFNSVLTIFATLLGLTRKLPTSTDDQNDDIPWRDTQDEVFVRWPGRGGTAQLHVYVTQAMILSLTYGCPSNYKGNGAMLDCDHLFAGLMNDWFSPDGYIIPKAYLMDTQEEAVLLPDWLRVKMLHCNTKSETLRLSIAASHDLDLKQTILCVQSFGIPVPTMDRLLNFLDRYSSQTPDQVTLLANKNSTFMTTLVQAQWKRGCQCGYNFVHLISSSKRPSVIQLTTTSSAAVDEIVDLTDDKPSETSMEVDKPSVFLPKQLSVEEINYDEEDLNQFLLNYFESDSPTQKLFNRIVKMIHKPHETKSAIAETITDFLQLLKIENATLFTNGLFKKNNKSSIILRLLHKKAFVAAVKKEGSDMDVENNDIETAKKSFNEIIEILTTKATQLGFVESENTLVSFLTSFKGSDNADDKPSGSSELLQSHWSRLEEFLKQQLASLKRNEEIKEKVDLVAQILLEEISSRKTKVGRGKGDVNDDKFYTSVGTTGLLIDWLQLLDPELLAHHPALQRKLVFELQKITIPSMPIKMSAKMSASNKLPFSLSAHQTYLLSLLTDHCNWATVHQCLKWILSEASLDGNEKGKQGIAVDPSTAMDFLWVCIHMSNIWKGRENKSSCLKEPVLYLSTKQFCKVLVFLVASATKRSNIPRSLRNETIHFDLFLLYFNKFGQANTSPEHMEEIVKFIHKKSTQQQNPDIWRTLLAQLFLLQPHHSVWDQKIDSSDDQTTYVSNATIFQSVVDCEVGTLCYTDLLVEKLLDKLGYVRENDKTATANAENVIKSGRDEAYDASLILRKIASFRSSIILRQLPLIISMLNGRTRYEFQEFKTKNHLLFISQLGDILEIVGPRLFSPQYNDDMLTIMESYLQIIKNYCHRARKQTKEIMYCSLRLIVNFQAVSPSKAAILLNKYTDTLQNLMQVVYKDHEDVVNIVSNILHNLSTSSTSPQDNDESVVTTLERNNLEQPKEYLMPYLKMISKGQDLENVAQVLNDMQEPSTRKVRDLSLFLPHLVRIFSTCTDSSIRHAALSISMQVLKYQPKYSMKIILPAYMNCLKCYGSDPTFTSETSEQFLTPNSVDTDLIARDALTYLPDIIILCREKAMHLLNLAFKAGSKQAVGIQPVGSMGNIGTPLIQGAQSSWTNVEELISKSLSLLSGNI